VRKARLKKVVSSICTTMLTWGKLERMETNQMHFKWARWLERMGTNLIYYKWGCEWIVTSKKKYAHIHWAILYSIKNFGVGKFQRSCRSPHFKYGKMKHCDENLKKNTLVKEKKENHNNTSRSKNVLGEFSFVWGTLTPSHVLLEDTKKRSLCALV